MSIRPSCIGRNKELNCLQELKIINFGELKMKPEKLNQLLQLRGLMQKISDKSFQYSQLNKKYPMSAIITDEDVDVMMKIYEGLVQEVTDDINNYYQK